MSVTSSHLDEIIHRHHQTANLQVVFLDIEKYSRRRTAAQIETIHAFTRVLRHALDDTAAQYDAYAQANGVDLKKDVIVLPTGDGAAVVFTFDGLHDIHLQFALALLSRTFEHDMQNVCDKFVAQNWCNCHASYLVRVGISEGKGIVYRDVNGGYNVAGDVVNMAARVMSLVDGAQICFTTDAYRQIVDLVDDPALIDSFVEYSRVELKHGVKVEVYHYIGNGEPFLKTTPPGDLQLLMKMRAAADQMRSIGLPLPRLDDFDRDQMVRMVEGVAGAMSSMAAAVTPEAINTPVISPPKDNLNES